MPFDAFAIQSPTGGAPWADVVRMQLRTEAVWVVEGRIRLPTGEIAVHEPPVIRKISGYAGLASGWDGYDAVPPTKAAIEGAKHLYWALRVYGEPEVEIAGDGEISLVWHGESGNHFEIGTAADGAISYFGSDVSAPFLGELDDVNDSSLVEVRAFLAGLANESVHV